MPGGIPNVLFYLPHIEGKLTQVQMIISIHVFHVGCNYLCSVSHTDLQIAKQYCEEPDSPASLIFLQAANELMMTHNLRFLKQHLKMLLLYTVNWWL